MITDLTTQLRRDEGEKLWAYKDHLGYLTIGIGRLIDKAKNGGITQAESAYLFNNDLNKINEQLDVRLPWWRNLDPVRQGVLQNMAFQMGVDGLLGFKNTLNMIRTADYDGAAKGMIHSKWATQTPERALRLSNQMRDGKWY